MKWEIELVKDALKSVPGIELKGTTLPEHYTTEILLYKVTDANDGLYVCGFTTEQGGLKDNEIEMVSLHSEYSDGEESPEEANVVARALMTVVLRKLGYNVVRSFEPYF